LIGSALEVLIAALAIHWGFTGWAESSGRWLPAGPGWSHAHTRR
jgi:hypothetical protein